MTICYECYRQHILCPSPPSPIGTPTIHDELCLNEFLWFLQVCEIVYRYTLGILQVNCYSQAIKYINSYTACTASETLCLMTAPKVSICFCICILHLVTLQLCLKRRHNQVLRLNVIWIYFSAACRNSFDQLVYIAISSHCTDSPSSCDMLQVSE